MQDSHLKDWLHSLKATVQGPSLSALEQLPDLLASAQLRINSREVEPGDVFLALPGVGSHGSIYIPQALSQGAALVITDRITAEENDAFSDPRVLVYPDLNLQLPQLVSRFYRDAATQMQLVGITGTNGKSSTAIFVNQLSRLLGVRSAVIGTLGYGEFPAFRPLQNTTPHLVHLHRIFAQLQQQGCQRIAMEVSSHAMVQQRVSGLKFDVAVFTNLTHDHLDYHGDMTQYFAAKAALFTPDYAKAAVVNVSDPYGQQLAAKTNLPLLVYGKAADCQGYARFLAYEQLQCDGHGFRCKLISHLGNITLKIPLLAEFNVQNALAAMAVHLLCGHALSDLASAVSQLVSVPGRMEQFMFPQDVTVVIDYAHTPDALQQSLVALRQQCRGHLWCVFGCGGDRDASKRPAMGSIAEQYADHVVVTADNPRTEDVMAICQQIVAGMQTAANCQIEPDRELAIKLALIEAHAGDMILVAGKGHEAYQIIGTHSRDYDERKYISSLLAEMCR